MSVHEQQRGRERHGFLEKWQVWLRGDRMDNETSVSDLAEYLFQQKEARRRELAALPFEEKIKILVRLQHLASEISQEVRGHSRQPWRLDE
jgi:hypothetical protein